MYIEKLAVCSKREQITSLDFQRGGESNRLAVSSLHKIRIYKLPKNVTCFKSQTKAEFLFESDEHKLNYINTVRWSFDGKFLASCDSGGFIICYELDVNRMKLNQKRVFVENVINNENGIGIGISGGDNCNENENNDGIGNEIGSINEFTNGNKNENINGTVNENCNENENKENIKGVIETLNANISGNENANKDNIKSATDIANGSEQKDDNFNGNEIEKIDELIKGNENGNENKNGILSDFGNNNKDGIKNETMNWNCNGSLDLNKNWNDDMNKNCSGNCNWNWNWSWSWNEEEAYKKCYNDADNNNKNTNENGIIGYGSNSIVENEINSSKLLCDKEKEKMDINSFIPVSSNKEEWKVIRCLKISDDGEIFDISWSKDSAFIVCAATRGNVYICNVKEGYVTHKLFARGTRENIKGVSFHPTDNAVVAQSSDNLFSIWKKRKTFYKNENNKMLLKKNQKYGQNNLSSLPNGYTTYHEFYEYVYEENLNTKYKNVETPTIRHIYFDRFGKYASITHVPSGGKNCGVLLKFEGDDNIKRNRIFLEGHDSCVRVAQIGSKIYVDAQKKKIILSILPMQ